MSRTPAVLAPSGAPRVLTERRAAWLLGALGAATLACYAALWLAPLRLDRFDPFSGPAQAVAPILGLDAGAVTLYAAAFLCPTLLYAAALALVGKAPARPALAIAASVTVAAPLVLLLTYPALAADVFDYLMSARMVSEYGANPYLTTASAFPDDPYYPPVGWKGLPSPYGPVWVWLTTIPTALAGDCPLAALILMKLLVVGMHLGVAWLVYRSARLRAPDRAIWSLIAYGWNPLVVVHFAVDAHNDAAMLLFLAGALYLALRGQWEFSLPCLTLTILTKYVPVLLVPLFLLAARSQPRRAAAGAALSALLALAVLAPLWAGPDTLDGVRDQGSRMTSSPAALLGYRLPDAWLRPLAAAVFGAGYLALLLRVRGLAARSYGVLALYYVTLSFWTKGWYFTWVVALGALAGPPALAVAALAGTGAFVSNLFGGWGWLMDWWGWQARWGIGMMEVWLTACLYVPWMLGAAWAAGRALRRRRMRAGA